MSDYETVQGRRNLVVGVFVAVGLCAFGWLVFKFGDLPSWASKFRAFEVRVQFPSAPGVQKDTPVRFCGYQIGRVTEVMPPEIRPEIRPDHQAGRRYYQTVVVMSIDKRYSGIPEASQIRLMTRGLGSSFIEIRAPVMEPDVAAGGVLRGGALVQGATGTSSEFFPEESQKKIEALVDGLGLFIHNVNELVGDPNNRENIGTVLAKLAQASGKATTTLDQAEKTLQEASKAIEEYRKLAAAGQETLRHADANVGQLASAMIATTEEVGKAAVQLRMVLDKVNQGQGTMARLVNDGRLYESLLESLEQVQVLLAELHGFVSKSQDSGLPIKLK